MPRPIAANSLKNSALAGIAIRHLCCLPPLTDDGCQITPLQGFAIRLITLVGRCPTLGYGAPSGLVQVLMSPTHLGKRLSKAYEFALHHSIPAGLPKRLKIRALSTLHSLLSTLYTLPHAEHLSPSLAGMFDSAPSGLAHAVDRVGWAMPNPERWRPFRACQDIDVPYTLEYRLSGLCRSSPAAIHVL